jgi:aminopeptidase N
MYAAGDPDGGRVWFPCVDSLTERCTYSMRISVDPAFLVVCSGELKLQVRCADLFK